MYKEALRSIQPNFSKAEPLASPWQIRNEKTAFQPSETQTRTTDSQSVITQSQQSYAVKEDPKNKTVSNKDFDFDMKTTVRSRKYTEAKRELEELKAKFTTSPELRERNEKAENRMNQIGGILKDPKSGKALVPGGKATKTAAKQDYYPWKTNQTIPETANRLDYHTYDESEIAHVKKLDESTMKAEAKDHFKKNEESKTEGQINNVVLTKQKNDRKCRHF